MRISHVLAFAAVATLSASAFAAPLGSIEPSSQATNTALVQAPQHTHKLSADDARAMRGTYRLDDGRMLVLTSTRSQVFAEFDGRREELLPVQGSRFVSRDTGAELTFDRVPFASQVVLSQAK
jgi:hypothetical protein